MTDKLFKRYNSVMQKVFEEKMDEVATKKEYFAVIKYAREEFEKELIDSLSTEQTLRSAIEKEGIDYVLDMALMICDMYLPYSLVSILHETIGAEGIKSRILDETRPQADRASLINALTGHETDDTISFLINLIISTDSELLMEESSYVLSAFNKDNVYDRIFEYFNQNGINEDLLSVLVEMFRESDKKDHIYKMLRAYFLTATDKGLVANIMADLDDSRAVVFLRGYLSKNIYNIKKSEITDICSAISRMGGYVEDFIRYNPKMQS
ncbi:MAG: hypothetical protein GXY21_10030 [Clostridiaceae bacterium]|jgi:hypothetical protein|nr:hypothetical protein [Clostridia bacterium]NLV34855.1 hypothetical protein [Clostridiaceae bacterium]